MSLRQRILAIALSTIFSSAAFAGPDCVVMIHGMWRTHNSFTKLATQLRSQGYFVVNESYQTNRYSIRTVANRDVQRWVKQCRRLHARRIHFVTHSIGGLVVREYLSHHRVPKGSRVVMLAPPNHGSVLADRMTHVPGYGAVMGPMGAQLRTGKTSYSAKLPQRLGVDVGVITGDRTFNPFASYRLGGPNDGKVSVLSARLAGMKDFLVVHSTHTFIMRSPRVIRNVTHFLRYGRFIHRK